MQQIEKHLSVLRKSQLFKGLDDNEILSSISCLCSSIKTVPKNTAVFLEGSPSSLCAIVLSGEIVLQKSDFNGSQNIIARMFPSQILAAASVFSSRSCHPFDAFSASISELLPFDKTKLLRPCRNACRFHSVILENLLTVISDNNVILAEKIDILTKRTIREKILAYLYSQSKQVSGEIFSVGLNRRQMSEYLSVDRSALSRELSKMKDERLIEFEGNRFRLSNSVLKIQDTF